MINSLHKNFDLCLSVSDCSKSKSIIFQIIIKYKYTCIFLKSNKIVDND